MHVADRLLDSGPEPCRVKWGLQLAPQFVEMLDMHLLTSEISMHQQRLILV